MVAKAFFMNVTKKYKTFCPKKNFTVFKGAIFGIFENTKTFDKMFYYFFVTFMKNAYSTISSSQQQRTTKSQ